MFGNYRIIHRLILLAVLVTVVFTVNAQNSVYNQFDRAQGLNSNTIYSIFQDSKGFLWIGTDLGLHRYNGSQFQEIDLPEDVESVEVYKIWENHLGEIWISTRFSQLYKIKQQKLHHYEHQKIIDNITSKKLFLHDVFHKKNNELVFYSRDQGSYLIDGLGNLTKLDFKKSTFSYIDDQWKLNGPSRISFTGKEKFDFFLNNAQGENLEFTEPYFGPTGYNVIRLAGSKNQFSFSIEEVLYSWAKGQDDIIITQFDHTIASIAIGPKGRIWVGTILGGLFCSDENQEKFHQVLPEFTNDFITVLFFDNENNLWVGTDKFGLLQIQPWMRKSKRYRNDGVDQQTKSLILQNDTLFIGYYKSTLGKVAIHANDPMFNITHPGLKELTDLAYIPALDKIVTVSMTKSLHLSKLNRDLKFYGPENEFQTNCRSLKWINGRLFGFGANDVTEFNQELVPIDTVKANYRDLGLFRDITMYDNKIITGSDSGFFELVDKKVVPIRIFNNRKKKYSVNVLTTNSGNFFCGTTADGLVSIVNQNVVILNTDHGLPSNNISALYSDNEHIYIGTTKGMVKCAISELGKKNPKLGQILPSVRISNIKSNIPDGNRIPQVHLDYISDGKTFIDHPISELKISRKTAFTKIAFKAIDVFDNGKFQYEYNLNDGSNAWIPTDNGEVVLSNLNPGVHQFDFRAKRNNGPFSTTSSMMIEVPALFYETWWFYVSMFLLTILIGAYIYYYLNKRHKLELNAMNRELTLNQQILQAKMNPHFIFNSLNSLKLFIKKGDNVVAENYLGKFSSLLRNIFEYSNSDVTNLSKEIEYISKYVELEGKRFSDGLAFKIHMDPNIDPNATKIPTMVIQPLVENAIWHGLSHSRVEKKLDIFLQLDHNNLNVKIVDNGVGLERSKEFIPQQDEEDLEKHSMSKTKLRFELLSKLNNRSFEIKHYPENPNNKENPGTTCELLIPINL